MDISQTFELIKTGTCKIAPEDELKKKLASGKKLRIKLGADPTAPDLHLGHAVVLGKLKLFQDLGHEIIFLIGDFTASIGDPTGRSKTRPPLSSEQIQVNTKTYLEQVGRILDTKKLTVAYNSTWLSALTSVEWVALCAKITLSRLIEREDFANRLAGNIPIGFHELLYPLMQGYDSVHLKADIELGGTDQTFNLLMGRHLQEQYGQEPQVILTTPLLEGLDGSVKMSKSLGNTIGLTESPDQVFGKIMSISDALMWRYYELLLNKPVAEIAQMQEKASNGSLHPMDLKKQLAHGVLERFWGAGAAQQGQEAFEHLFQKKDFSHAQQVVLSVGTPEALWIVDLLKTIGAVTSTSEARRLIDEGAVTVNDEKITDFGALVALGATPVQLKVGKKKFYSITRGS